MAKESLSSQYPEDAFQETQIEDLESRMNNLINSEPSQGIDKPNEETETKYGLSSVASGSIPPQNEIGLNNAQNNIQHVPTGVSLEKTVENETNNSVNGEANDKNNKELHDDALNRMTEAVFDETSTINRDMITRHNKMQKLLAKRQERLSKLAKIVGDQIDSLDNNAAATGSGSILVSDDESSESDEDEKPIVKSKEKVSSQIPSDLNGDSSQSSSTQIVNSFIPPELAEVAERTPDEASLNTSDQHNNNSKSLRRKAHINSKKQTSIEFDFAGIAGIYQSKDKLNNSRTFTETLKTPQNSRKDIDNVTESLPDGSYSDKEYVEQSDEDDEDREKYSKIYSSMQKSKLLEELAENEKELLLLEEMSKVEINKTKKKDKKALLDIAARTQELSIKYTRCEPILYSKLEVVKDSLLDEFGFVNGQFSQVKQSTNSQLIKKESDTVVYSSSSQVEEPYQNSEFDLLDNASTDESEIAEVKLEHEISRSKDKSIVSGRQFDKYFDSLKEKITTEGNIELSDSDTNSGEENIDDSLSSSVLDKKRMFELKVKFAKKRKQKQLNQQKTANDKLNDFDLVTKKQENLNKSQIISLMMERHRSQVRDKLVTNKKDDDYFSDSSNESDEDMDLDGADDDLSIRKLMQNEMVYNLRKADRLRVLNEEKSNGNDLEDEDYEYEVSSSEEDSAISDEDEKEGHEDEDEINDTTEGIDKKKEKSNNLKIDVNEEIEMSTQIKYNVESVDNDILDNNNDEDDTVVAGKAKKKQSIVLSDDDNDADLKNCQTEQAEHNNISSKQSVTNTSIEEENEALDDEACFNGAGLTQKIKNIFGNASDKGGLTQIFENTQESSIPQTQRVLSMSSLSKTDTMSDEPASLAATAEDEDEFRLNNSSAVKAQYNESFVVGFDFSVSKKEEEDSIKKSFTEREADDSNVVGATETDPSNQNINAKEIIGVKNHEIKKGKLMRIVDIENGKKRNRREEAEEEDEFAGMNKDELEQLRIEQNKQMFMHQRNEEIKLRKKELKMKQKLGDVFDKEAEESDDEWAELHGGEDNEVADAVTKEDLEMIDNLTKNNDRLDEEKFLKLHADEELAKDQGILEKLQRDLENGQLGKRRGNRNFMEINDEDEDYLEDLERRKYLWKRRERQRKRLLEQQNVEGLSKNKNAKAFFACIAEETDTFSFRESIAKQYLKDNYVVDEEEEEDATGKEEEHEQNSEENKRARGGAGDFEIKKKRKIVISDQYIRKTLSFIDDDDEQKIEQIEEEPTIQESVYSVGDDEDEFMKLQARSVFIKGLSQKQEIKVSVDTQECFTELF